MTHVYDLQTDQRQATWIFSVDHAYRDIWKKAVSHQILNLEQNN